MKPFYSINKKVNNSQAAPSPPACCACTARCPRGAPRVTLAHVLHRSRLAVVHALRYRSQTADLAQHGPTDELRGHAPGDSIHPPAKPGDGLSRCHSVRYLLHQRGDQGTEALGCYITVSGKQRARLSLAGHPPPPGPSDWLGHGLQGAAPQGCGRPGFLCRVGQHYEWSL